ncbi:hypothetical protein Aca07nite_48070 [Actinoplanes capillaceus]|uniref:Hemolysin-type calcium-binding repeat-containing protein n=1 Tax=Actinoplanes campanulatus TaxID=113559 RepID=A0ABQ3WMT4_9ACTN|nr:hypothetical protein [Actinoplanes capillaceus]GID47532.1 hypothetical protein Aca07nite_48070 [Actinoplanes capillaceus]
MADGNDVIHAGAGVDSIHGGEGKDKLYGDAGDDFLDGGGYDKHVREGRKGHAGQLRVLTARHARGVRTGSWPVSARHP